jgi:hypothetical protein
MLPRRMLFAARRSSSTVRRLIKSAHLAEDADQGPVIEVLCMLLQRRSKPDPTNVRWVPAAMAAPNSDAPTRHFYRVEMLKVDCKQCSDGVHMPDSTAAASKHHQYQGHCGCRGTHTRHDRCCVSDGAWCNLQNVDHRHAVASAPQFTALVSWW